MRINDELCIGCAKCLKFCPMQAISILNKKAVINLDLCAECGVCFRLGICEKNAFCPEESLPWPRSLRSIFSNPVTVFKETGCTGRGTEEMKTNDVTNRFKNSSIIGFAVDIGRPNVGCQIKDAQVITRVLAPLDVEFEKSNPLSYLMKDYKTGDILDEVLDERVVSCIVEFSVPIDKAPQVMDALMQVENSVDTVFSISVICRVDDDLSIPVIPILEQSGYRVKKSVKTNVGLGRR